MDGLCCKVHGVRTLDEVRVHYYLKDGTPRYECKACVKVRAKVSYERTKHLHAARAKAWAKANPEARRVIELKSRHKHKEAYRARVLASSARHGRRCTAELRDHYVRKVLTLHTGLKSEDIPASLVELKRASLKLMRKLRDANDEAS